MIITKKLYKLKHVFISLGIALVTFIYMSSTKEELPLWLMLLTSSTVWWYFSIFLYTHGVIKHKESFTYNMVSGEFIDDVDMLQFLNTKAKDGWELVAVKPDTEKFQSFKFLFKIPE